METAILIAAGTASSVLKGLLDTVGFEAGSQVLGVAKDASFNCVRSTWSEQDLETLNKMEQLDYKVEKATRSQMARTAKQVAEIAKKNGDTDKYELYMNHYEIYRN